MNLHNEIMNLPCEPSQRDIMNDREITAHKIGHRDARHAAAELAIKSDSLIEEMKLQLEDILDWLEQGDVEDSFADPIRKLVGRPLGNPHYNCLECDEE